MPRKRHYPWNAWKHFSITEEQAKEDKRKAALRFNFTTLCPCKVDRNTVTDKWKSIYVFHEWADQVPPQRDENGLIDILPCEHHAKNVEAIEELWTLLEQRWAESLECMKGEFRELGMKMGRGEDAPYLHLHEEFYTQCVHFFAYVKYNIKAVSMNREGEVEEPVLKAQK